ncbi:MULTISPECIES: type II toxin-antitoxin system prevent-host-death family antitoxin [unclassified Streptomyces]|uniref:type II toxin-antitoxin system Phd/YefM family antitoxin n=1 Tax=unclassified Streptomyces TaxID=2593676 RepID=UPI002DD83453|nr:type II toxin-antitoxin system prevent-host-death family antitoxin [Streptomyces sp. NBC_01750]WSB03396.1 type II toxin-antitoxin system prevent-host-death family antitoxin [Streptomyces sp. NBC_01794]WSD32333.1 type II toxin-antitoxin system prevent-host-death family antitoxin [Streptomyces sp. NBC_01750]
MTTRVPIRRLQQHASELIERVASGERVETTRNGRLVAVLAPPDPEQRVMEDLVRTGTVDTENAESARGLGDRQPLAARPGPPARLSEVLPAMREEEDR